MDNLGLMKFRHVLVIAVLSSVAWLALFGMAMIFDGSWLDGAIVALIGIFMVIATLILTEGE